LEKFRARSLIYDPGSGGERERSKNTSWGGGGVGERKDMKQVKIFPTYGRVKQIASQIYRILPLNICRKERKRMLKGQGSSYYILEFSFPLRNEYSMIIMRKSVHS